MRLSCHTILVPDYPQSGEHLLYSTRTQALVKIDDALREILNQLTIAPYQEDILQRDDVRHLHRIGLLVRDDVEEREKLRSHLQQIKYSYNPAYLTVTLLTTYSCNFKCTYCFEESSRTNVKLSFETQEQVIRYLQRKMERLGYEALHINYYGGEPLLNQAAIENVSSQMLAWCEANGKKFDMALQTNGYLLTPEIVNKYKQYNLRHVRISLDGVGEDHDRNRPLRGGGGTFERIMKNIVDCADLIPIGLSIGFEKGNIDPIEKLINHLENLGVLHKLGRFVFSPIIPTLGPKGNPTAVRGSECSCNLDDAIYAQAVKKLNALLDAKGVANPKSGMSTSICPLTRENGGVTIDQEGKLYKCNSLLGHPEFAVGDVYHEEYNEKGKEFRDLDVWKQCPVDCTYLPMCSGGCRLMSFVGGHGNFKVASCKKPYLNMMAPEYIKRDYHRMVSQTKSHALREPALTKT